MPAPRLVLVLAATLLSCWATASHAAEPDRRKALQQAKLKRAAALQKQADVLLAAIDRVLAQKPANLGKKALGEYLGYRILRGHLLLAGMNRRQSVGPLKGKALKQMLRLYVANQKALHEELIATRERGMGDIYEGWGLKVDAAHKETASRLGAGNSPESISFLNPDRAARMGSYFLCFGNTPIFQGVDVRLGTAPAKLDPAWAKLATHWMDWAIADIAKHEKKFKERETIRAHDQYAECLMTLGRKGDAITQWQKILDGFPTSKEFPRISKKVEAALGVK